MLDTHDRQNQITKVSHSEWIIGGRNVEQMMSNLGPFFIRSFCSSDTQSFVHLNESNMEI